MQHGQKEEENGRFLFSFFSLRGKIFVGYFFYIASVCQRWRFRVLPLSTFTIFDDGGGGMATTSWNMRLMGVRDLIMTVCVGQKI